MRLSDALEIGYLDVMEGLLDGRENARYVPHFRPNGSCAGCGTPVSVERACDYCGSWGDR
jgi:hypothetical protein